MSEGVGVASAGGGGTWNLQPTSPLGGSPLTSSPQAGGWRSRSPHATGRGRWGGAHRGRKWEEGQVGKNQTETETEGRTMKIQTNMRCRLLLHFGVVDALFLVFQGALRGNHQREIPPGELSLLCDASWLLRPDAAGASHRDLLNHWENFAAQLRGNTTRETPTKTE